MHPHRGTGRPPRGHCQGILTSSGTARARSETGLLQLYRSSGPEPVCFAARVRILRPGSPLWGRRTRLGTTLSLDAPADAFQGGKHITPLSKSPMNFRFVPHRVGLSRAGCQVPRWCVLAPSSALPGPCQARAVCVGSLPAFRTPSVSSRRRPKHQPDRDALRTRRHRHAVRPIAGCC